MEFKTETPYSRTQMLLGEDAIRTLKGKHVTVLGLGGVGGHCAEALARCGVGRMFIVDSDTVSISNLNRQIVAQKSTVGKPKSEEMARRIEAVSDCEVLPAQIFLSPDIIPDVIPDTTDYIVDAIDNVTAKLSVINFARLNNIPIISAMGMGNRLDPTLVRIGDLFNVTGCPLARVMRRELRRRGINSLTCAYSLEEPLRPITNKEMKTPVMVPGSTPFVPAAGGIAMAYHVVMRLLAPSMN